MSGRDYRWVRSHNCAIPPQALICGTNFSNNPVYLGKAFYKDDVLPCSVVPSENNAYTCYNGKEVNVTAYEILVHKSLCWEVSSNGEVPNGALPGGRTSYGETLYVGRIHIEDEIIVGKIHPSHGCLYVPFCGGEAAHKVYEVLVYH